MAKNPFPKAFERKDKAADKKAGVKEGSAKDNAMDAMMMKKGGRVKKMKKGGRAC